MNYRGKVEIIADILKNVAKYEERATRYKIAFRSELSNKQFKQYCNYMIERDLMFYSHETGLLNITEKGRRYIDLFDKLNEIVNIKVFDAVSYDANVLRWRAKSKLTIESNKTTEVKAGLEPNKTIAIKGAIRGAVYI